MTEAEGVVPMQSVAGAQSPPAGGPPVCETAAEAVRAADRAARAAGVTLREIAELDGLVAVYQLYDNIWRPDPSNPPVTTELLRALTKGGNYVVGAFDGDELIGACVGFFSAPADKALHSHVAGVSARGRGRSVGFALKAHQRGWALRRGVSAITWTYDPLVSRNAYFNLGKLSAAVVEYLPNFYGGMNDGINGSDESDRLFVRWQLDSPRVATACSQARASFSDGTGAEAAVTALARSQEGGPLLGALEGETVFVAVPRDIETLRRTHPEQARKWRAAVRDVLSALLADGARVVGFERSGRYVVSRATVRGDAL
ncbi:GNAT family N-acetyltransferase [Streptomyces sp. DASNCL29]|nr:GNAT family N-acetyltransferase [Streptomyces sp. DASNCL29]